MPFRRTLVAVISSLVAVGALGLTGVAGADVAPAGDHVVRIGVLAPLDAGLVEFGTGIRNSVQLAVDQANEREAIKGWSIELVGANDSSDPPTGRASAKTLAADDAVVGVVGTYNSGVAAAALPELQPAHLALISPANTLTDLTVGPNAASPKRQYDNYFRMVASDARQGPFLAQSARQLGAKKVAVVSETKPVSKGLADAFAAAFSDAGGEVTVQQVVPDGAGSFTDFLRAATTTNPDMIFFGGEYNVAATLRTQATAAGLTKPLMGGDGIKDQAYITGAGTASKGTIASSVGTPADSLKTAKKFLAAYDKAGFAEPVTNFGPYAYDAANLVITAVAPLLKGKDTIPSDARQKVIAAIQKVKTTGASGPISFDKYGDTRNRVFTLYKVDGSGSALEFVAFKP